jgi:putative ABC transport system ATP-binding protein
MSTQPKRQDPGHDDSCAPGMGVRLAGVSKSFRDRSGRARIVLEGIELDCGPGAIVRLEGRSGSGKSTLLNLISGLLTPDKGEVHVGGSRIDALSESRRDRFRALHVGYVFQTFNLLSPLSAVENLVIPARLAGTAGADLEPRARASLAQLGLEDHLDKRPWELSVGQRQRVAVARAVVAGPALLLADEPTANLDEESSRAVISALDALHRAGTTLVLATHDPALKEAFPAQVLDVASGEVRP